MTLNASAFNQKIETWRREFVLDPSSPSGLKWASLNTSRKKPEMAGYCNERGYYVVKTGGKEYKCHQIVLALNGILPEADAYEVDHLDQNPSNNALTNLRWVNGSENCKNRRTTGQVPFKYVIRRGRRFAARYRHPLTREKVDVGSYGSPHEAYYEALAHRLEHHWIVQ